MTLDRYTFDDTISVGESSTIYRARGPVGPVAIKVLHPSFAADPVVSERFIAYAQSIAAIHDPGVVRIFDVIRQSVAEANGEPRVALVMELLEGGTLEGREDVDPADLLRRLVESLSVIHAAGIVHRDISPSHIAFGRDGLPRLIDFAGASVRDLAGLSRSTVHTTRREYADPHAWGMGASTPSQDLYSLGAVVHELLFGSPPAPRAGGLRTARTQPASSPESRRRGGGRYSYLASIVQAMVGEPHLRPRSAEEVRSWLDAGSGILQERVGECLYCGAIMPRDAVLCLECGQEPPSIRKDPYGEYIALRKLSEEQGVLGPFLRTLRLLAVEPEPQFNLILGDARLYSREERQRGTELPVRIADSIATESVAPLISLLTSPAPDRIHVERYPMSRLRKVKRGPLISLRYRDAPPAVGIAALRRAAKRAATADRPGAPATAGRPSTGTASRQPSRGRELRARFLHAVGIATRRLGSVSDDRIDSLISASERVFARYEQTLHAVESADLHAAYADIERAALADERADRESRAIFGEYSAAVRRLTAIESAVSRASLQLESVTRDRASAVFSEVAAILSEAATASRRSQSFQE